MLVATAETHMHTTLPPVGGVIGASFSEVVFSLDFVINSVFACGAPVMDVLTEVLGDRPPSYKHLSPHLTACISV